MDIILQYRILFKLHVVLGSMEVDDGDSEIDISVESELRRTDLEFYFETMKFDKSLVNRLGQKEIVIQENDSPRSYGGIVSVVISSQGKLGKYYLNGKPEPIRMNASPIEIASYIMNRSERERKAVSYEDIKKEIEEKLASLS